MVTNSITINPCPIKQLDPFTLSGAPAPHDTIPHIYIACEQSYLEGTLHGVWVEICPDLSVDEVEQYYIEDMLASSPATDAREYIIQASAGFFDMVVDPNDDLEQVLSMGQFIAEHKRLGVELLLDVHKNVDEAREIMKNYYGEYASREYFADCYTREHSHCECETHSEAKTCQVKEQLLRYLNTGKLARDLFMDSFLGIDIGDRVHVFSKC